jgi:N-acetylneuraminic acid mutarotase
MTAAASAESTPPVRVGAASVVVDGKIYLWGGRGGAAMAALEEDGRFWVFDPELSKWSRTPLTSGDIPQDRSYHSLAAIGVCLLCLV